MDFVNIVPVNQPYLDDLWSFSDLAEETAGVSARRMLSGGLARLPGTAER
jgi:hypothetical protein